MDTGYVTADGRIAEVEFANVSGVPTSTLDPMLRELAGKLTAWTEETRGRRSKSTLFERAKFVQSDNPYDQMRAAKAAVRDDDIVSAAADVTEGLVFQEVRWESSNEDIADIFNQLSKDLNLDAYLRTGYREVFTYSQTVGASRWGRRSYVPRTRTVQLAEDGTAKKGPERRRAVDLLVPTKLTTLDPLKVVPVGLSIFGESLLAWNATLDEATIYDGLGDPGSAIRYDAVMEELFAGRYIPRTSDEESELTALGVNVRALLEFQPDRVWRHTVTKSDYERFADLRMRSIFPLLDLKQQQMAADRVTLVGAANYILLVKKGDKDAPGTPEEIANLKDGFRVLAKLPVIVSDHRLSIEIITPSVDNTLQQDRYDLIDLRILRRLFGILETDDLSATRTIARLLENRRHMLRRSIEEHVLDAVWNHPDNAEALSRFKADEKPSLAFNPRHVQLDNDALMLQLILQARQAEELSRQSFLDFLGFDQDVEARRREREQALYPSWKQVVPFNSPENGAGDGSGEKPEPPGTAGARGGRPAGGGASPKSAKGSVKPRTATGAPSTRK